MNRIAVRYKNKPLMPMKCSRIQKFINTGKGKIRYDTKLDLFYMQLLVNPSGDKSQDIAIGLDPGSCFDGFSVISGDCHHLNIELKQRDKKGNKSISFLKTRQSQNRRVRRSRLRHRKIRFYNRTKHKLAPTINANVEFRGWLIKKLLKYFPITKIGIEDVKFNHYNNKNGRSFSHVEQGKTKLYHDVQDLGLELYLVNGYETKNLRYDIFGCDPKIRAKDKESFDAHCVDSFVIALSGIRSDKTVKVNGRVVYIKKKFRYRRYLFQDRPARYKGKDNYYRLKPQGEKEYYEKLSRKPKKVRIKPEGCHSNHPNHWIYQNNGFDIRKKKSKRRFGGKPTERNFYGEYINRYITKSVEFFNENTIRYIPIVNLNI